MAEANVPAYGIAPIQAAAPTAAPELPYEPVHLSGYEPGIALVGCGGVSQHHLAAYRHAGYRVVALVDRHLERAERRREEFFPRAKVYADYRQLLTREEIEIVDLTPHPHDRWPLIEDFLRAGKHVLSQKPFVLDLAEGARLMKLARQNGVNLAINHNGRWAPHFSYLRLLLAGGYLGDLVAVHAGVHWDHHWITGTAFEAMESLILFDFGIHWFDILTCFLQERSARRVMATTSRSKGQKARPPLLAQCLVEFEGGQASLIFDGDTRWAPRDQTLVIGTRGTARSEGPDLQEQRISVTTDQGTFSPALNGHWFVQGFHGAMAELQMAIQQNRKPFHDGENVLKSLALCFAAIESARKGLPVEVGSATRITP